MKTNKFLSIFVVAVALSALLQCTDDDAITYEVRDVSDRVSGFGSDVTGPGAALTVTGSNMDELLRIAVGDAVVPRKSFTSVTESSVTFSVPTSVGIGTADVLFVWPGADRGFASINVVPIPVFGYADPDAASEGETVTIYGANLDVVDAVTLSGTAATIASKSADKITVTVPAGATTGPIAIESPVGSSSSSADFVACGTDGTHPKCLTPLNTNGGFENGTLGVVGSGGAAGGNWYLAANGTRATYEIIEAPGGAPNLGEKTLKVTITALGANNWEIQVVNDGFPVPAGKRFNYMGRIWADRPGRVVRLAGGVSVPGYQDMEGGVQITLNEGWNDFSIEIVHTTPPQDDTQVRLQANFSYPENDAATFYFDDFRVVVVGDR